MALRLVGAVLALLGAAMALTGWWRFSTVERTDRRRGGALPGWLTAVLGGLLGTLGAVLTVLLVAT